MVAWRTKQAKINGKLKSNIAHVRVIEDELKGIRKLWTGTKVTFQIVAFVGFIFGIYIFYQEQSDRKQNSAAQVATAISRSWETLSRRGLGDSGKSNALQFLLLNNENISYVDLSCETIARGLGPFADFKKPCLGQPVFNGLELRMLPDEYELGWGGKFLQRAIGVIPTWEDDYMGFRDVNLSGSKMVHSMFKRIGFDNANFDKIILFKTNFFNTYIYSSSFVGAKFTHVRIEDSDLEFIDFSNSEFWAFSTYSSNFSNNNFENTKFSDSLFEGTNLYKTSFQGATLSDVEFRGSNLTGVSFEDANLLNVEFVDVWASENNPPIGLPEEVVVTLCEDMYPWTQLSKNRTGNCNI